MKHIFIAETTAQMVCVITDTSMTTEAVEKLREKLRLAVSFADTSRSPESCTLEVVLEVRALRMISWLLGTTGRSKYL